MFTGWYLFFSTKIKIILYIIPLLAIAGCGSRVNAATESPLLPTQTPIQTLTPIYGGLLVNTRVECSCIGQSIIPTLYIEPLNGTPLYILPGFDFANIQTISANLNDVLHITIYSSDIPALTWTGDINMVCIVVPACGDSVGVSTPTSMPIIVPTSTHSGGNNSNGDNGSTSTSSSSTSSSSTSSSSTSSGGGPPGIPNCPPPNEGGEPPGICKKK